MHQISNSNCQAIAGGFGYYPGYSYEDHLRGSQEALKAMAGLGYGFFTGLWNTLVDNAR